EVRINHHPIDSGDWLDMPGASGWRFTSVHLPSGMNRLETTDPRGIGACSYGFAYHDAYTAFTGFGAWRTASGGAQDAPPGEVFLHAPWPNPSAGSDVFTAITLPHPERAELTL